MKMILTPASTPDEYIECLSSWPTTWQHGFARALRDAVREAALGANLALQERLKWGHLLYVSQGPVLVIRAEPQRVLMSFFRGQRLRPIEPRLKPGGKYEMATLTLRPDTPLQRETVLQLVREAVRLNREFGDPTVTSSAPAR